ncbi:unnamed protein product [Paramecium sonneborni]|uniref:Uncharacterized protein n=1 Tax=Paramecium sonneborni TaxID=65129 RepID=A0A8S1QV09_9CILI|nr:unnamed protein product [Paramecium sonneborni]
MGAQICPNAQHKSHDEITVQKKPKIDIQKPPQIHKLEPIIQLSFHEEIMEIQRERQYSIPKQTTQDYSTSKLEINENKIEQLEQFEKSQLCSQNDQKDQQNDSRDDSNSALLEFKFKPILKNVIAQKNCQNDGESQKSVKKVTFNKKQKVIYSGFRQQNQ